MPLSTSSLAAAPAAGAALKRGVPMLQPAPPGSGLPSPVLQAASAPPAPPTPPAPTTPTAARKEGATAPGSPSTGSPQSSSNSSSPTSSKGSPAGEGANDKRDLAASPDAAAAPAAAAEVPAERSPEHFRPRRYQGSCGA
eukprot:CAMPEP_0115513024 /NCGR_PEP_ID=MMETSP0271-20121206/74842_1 /TAXON_ID=71861 /ORGANISM="Scrippsiella trochoidea, Strain CCMP3099" /LENGTH=139 /DNA_ID=CAMNT_0002943261 /DNA_START=82 /DNA_END=498 /DNA_ORIENTATION=+